MLCAKCGAQNTDTAIVCKICSALLGVAQQSGRPPVKNLLGQPFSSGPWDLARLPAEQQATAFKAQQVQPATPPEQSWFAPVAHSPFSDIPLPQPSQPLPAVIPPAGEILSFTPLSSLGQAASPTPQSPMDIADYPTNARVPVPGISPSLPAADLPVAEQLPGHFFSPPVSQPLDNISSGQSMNAWGQVGNNSGFEQRAPLSQPLDQTYPGFAGFAAFDQTPPALSPLNEMYSGSVSDAWGEVDNFSATSDQTPPPSQPLDQALLSFPIQFQSSSSASQPLGNAFSDAGLYDQMTLAAQTLGNVYPGQTNSTGSGRSTSSSLTLLGPETNKIVKPLPLWVSLVGSIIGALLLVALVFFNTDWAAGAMIAGVIAIVMAVLLIIVAGVRTALGMLASSNPHRRTQVGSVVLLVLLLFLFSGIGLTQQTSLHAMQARHLEAQQSWQQAVNEYQAAGEVAPASLNLARVYNEWGEALSDQQQYASAVTKFNTILSIYNQVPGQVSLARTNMLAAYQAWGTSAAQKQNYLDATSHYDTLLGLNYCSASCQSGIQPLDATAYYNLAEQQLTAQQFVPAVNAFGVLATRFSSAPEAKKIHADYAKALWGLGQQQLNTTCANAVKTYQQLSKQFADTNQGQQATTALAQPVAVKGHFTTQIPVAPNNPTVVLVQGLTVGILPYQFRLLLEGAPSTTINSDGTFTFAAVPQGTYELVWSGDGKLHFYYDHNGAQVLYSANLGPLCTYSYGDISETIPTA